MITIPKDIKHDLNMIDNVCEDLKMKLYVVGGFPRDIVSGVGVDDDTDLDVTEKNGNAFDLAFFVAAKYGLSEPVIYERSGTALIIMPSGRKVEFHNAYYNVPHILDELYLKGVKPTPINKDVYARDFTINSLLLDTVTHEILDLTGRGKEDIKNRYLRTPLSAKKTLSTDPHRFLRAIRFKVQFDMSVDPDLENAMMIYVPYVAKFMEENPDSNRIQNVIKKTFVINPEAAYNEFSEWGLIQYLPHNEDLNKLIKNKMFGTTVFPTRKTIEKTSQSQMIRRLLDDRDKHKAYLRRKKREKAQELKKRLEIMDKIRSKYYYNNDETKYLRDNPRNIKRGPDYEFIKKPR